jgi:hypothetical protein
MEKNYVRFEVITAVTMKNAQKTPFFIVTAVETSKLTQLFIDFRKAYDSVSREVLSNILIECGTPMKLVQLIETCLSETYSKDRIGTYLSDSFPIQDGLKQGDTLWPLLLNFSLEYAPLGRPRKTKWN